MPSSGRTCILATWPFQLTASRLARSSFRAKYRWPEAGRDTRPTSPRNLRPSTALFSTRSSRDFYSILGVSRSALVGEFLADGVSHVRKLLEIIPPNPTPADVLRLRGESADVIRARLDQLKGMTDDLFSE